MMCSALYLLTDCVKRRLLLHYFVLHKFTRPGGGVWRGVEIQDQKVQAGLRLEGGGAILPRNPAFSTFLFCPLCLEMLGNWNFGSIEMEVIPDQEIHII